MDITLILHHGGYLERDEYRRLNYVRGEICVWEKLAVDVLSLWDIEKFVKHCRGYFKVSKLWYFKPFKSAAIQGQNDVNGFAIEAVLRQCVPAKRYCIRGPVISNERPKQTPVRGPAADIVRVPYPNYGPSGSSQPKFMEFIPTLDFPKK